MGGGNAWIYARVSTDDGRQNTANQLDLLRKWAIELGLRVTKEYVDQASGGTGDRVQFQQMLMDSKTATPGTFLLFYSLDRLSREGALKTLGYLDQIHKSGIISKSLTESHLQADSPMYDVIVAFMATLARMEKQKIGERTRAGLARVKREGSKSGKPIGRPLADIDMDYARSLKRTHSERNVAKILGVKLSTLRTRLHGRHVKKEVPLWSEPVWGVMDGEFFREEVGGRVVVRYDRRNGKPWCMVHQVELGECGNQHQEAIQ